MHLYRKKIVLIRENENKVDAAEKASTFVCLNSVEFFGILDVGLNSFLEAGLDPTTNI